MYTYLLLNVFTLLGPMTRAFEPRIRFYKEWPYLFTGIAASGLVFLLWDEVFTVQGIWGFNPDYLTGIYFGHLPLEEWLFFLTVPYASIFIYATYNYFMTWEAGDGLMRGVTVVLGLVILFLGIWYHERVYTHITFLLSGSFLLIQGLLIKGRYMGRFLLSYIIVLIPFFMVNGVLTGSWTPEPIVWYNDQENLGIRIGTIPIEDSVYGLLMLLIAVTVYEELRNRFEGKYSFEKPQFVVTRKSSVA